MNKKLIASITTALVIGTFGTTFASPADSFNDVPKDHWAYQAVQKLAEDGVIEGYSDGEFKGDRPLTRYEFSMVVAKAIDKFETASDDDQRTIDKLSAEFASELNRLGKRVAIVEKKTKTWMGGETRVRYMDNNPKNGGTKLKGADKFDLRQRITIKAEVDKDITFDGRLSASGKFGNDTSKSGTSVSLDRANITAKNVWGLDRIRVGRSALDSIGNGLISKPQNADGLLIEKNFGATKFTAYTGNPESSEVNGDAQQFTTAQFTQKINKNLNFSIGHYWSDAIATEKGNGMGDLNISGPAAGQTAYKSSDGTSLSLNWRMGKYTLLTDYIMTNLDGVTDQRLASNPKGWAVQFGTLVGPPVYYNAGMLVDKTKKGMDGWMVSYRSIDAGAIPNAVGGFNTMGVSYSTDPYNIFTHATDNVNVLFLAYQKVLRENVVMALEYQDFKTRDQGLTNLSSKQLDKTYQAKFTFWY